MEQSEVRKIIEALLFATDTPLAVNKIKDILPDMSPSEIKETINALSHDYESQERVFLIQEIAGGFQIRTRPEYQSWLIKLKTQRDETKLSNAALEVLSIISYKQPVMRAEIEAIRGVDSSTIIRALMENGLIRITGRASELGRPIIYGTTPKFLELVGLNSIGDLPKAVELR